ncbi:MFS transporter [Quadrisphaera setariae]|uniref:MFS transporter n=1 Tax=Quadrisphaera setariae TaxID=2593304 RepID=A0A5C8ZIT1_9ACTN|nr:MFS transporter [Quadrisphaera setariae]TXR56780.1 MFS transporter [Quadrisphaera setariae]
MSQHSTAGGFDRNARVAIATEGLWALFGTPALFYVAVYMTTGGLSAAQAGLLISVGTYLGCVWQLFAGAITDRWGRRWTTTVFDLLSWVLPMLVWACAQDVWWFLAGWVLNSAAKVVGVSFGLLAVEDSPEHVRARIFAALKLIALLAGLFVPLVGLAITRWGPETAFRWLFGIGGVSMLAHVVVRHVLVRETRAGAEAMAAHRPAGLRTGLWVSVTAVVRACQRGGARRVVVVYVATTLASQLTLFQALFLTDALAVSPLWVSAVPAVGALASLACYLGVMPRWDRRLSAGRATAWALVVAVAGWTLFAALPAAPPVAVVVIAAGVAAAGPFLLESYRDAVVVAAAEPDRTASFYAAVQTAASFAAVPVGLVAGTLYDWSPRGPLALSAVLYAVALMAALPATFGQRPQGSV